MPVQMFCPNLKCRKILSVPEDARGKLVKCQYCQTMLRVPPAKAFDPPNHLPVLPKLRRLPAFARLV